MSYYMSIEAVGFPADIGVDPDGRILISCNYESRAHGPISTWEDDLLTLLTNAGVAVGGTDTFIGTLKTVDPSLSPYTRILNTGGHGGPWRTQNDDLYENLSTQIIVGAKDYDTAMTRALAIRNVLNGVYNTNVP